MGETVWNWENWMQRDSGKAVMISACRGGMHPFLLIGRSVQTRIELRLGRGTLGVRKPASPILLPGLGSGCRELPRTNRNCQP